MGRAHIADLKLMRNYVRRTTVTSSVDFQARSLPIRLPIIFARRFDGENAALEP